MLDAGNFSAISGREQKLLTRYFMKGMALLDYAAVNVGPGEMRQGLSVIREANTQAKLPLLSSNLTDADNKPLFADVMRVKYLGRPFVILGFADNVTLAEEDKASVRVLPVEEAVKALAGKITKKKDELLVVLAAVDEKAVEKIVELLPQTDLIICSNIYRYNEAPFKLKDTWIVSDTKQTRNILGLSFNVVKGRIDAPAGSKIALEPKYDKNPKVDAVFEDYKAALKSEKFKWPRPKDAQKVNAGAEACAACHAYEYGRWSKDPHRKALEPLIKEGQQYNPECLNCHVTGYERENGFWDVESSMDMAGVQCEQCHGPLMNHVSEENELGLSGQAFIGGLQAQAGPTRKYKPYKIKFYICARCHTADKDKALSTTPEEAWKTFGHSKP